MSNIKTRDHFIKLPQGRIFAREWLSPVTDRKAPIILIHDSLGCVELWRDFPNALSDRLERRVIAFDRLGFGRSDPRSGTIPLNFVDEPANLCLPAIFDQLSIRDFILFGHSVGGAMAVVGASAFGDRCHAVITESAQAFIEDKTLRAITEAKIKFQKGNQIERLRKYRGAKAEWVFAAWTDTWLSPQFASWSLKDVLPGVKCPLLAIHGDQDEYGTLKHPKMICDLASGSHHRVILSNCGHLPHRERTDEVIELVAEFTSNL